MGTSLLRQLVQLDGWIERSEYATWGVQYAGHLLGTWCVLVLSATPVQIVATFLQPDSKRAALSWFPCEVLYFWAIPLLILYFQKRQRFDLVRLLFLSFTLLEYTACYLVWSYIRRVPDLYARLEQSFDWALLPCTFGLQLAVVKLRPAANALLVIFSMAVRTCFHMRVFKATAVVALFKATFANGLGLLFARTIERYMRAAYEQHRRQASAMSTSSAKREDEDGSLLSKQASQPQVPPPPQQQQQQLSAEQPGHVRRTEAVIQAMQEARSSSKRQRRAQVNIVITEGLVPEDIGSNAVQRLSREISMRFPGSMVLSVAVRRACVILSFTLQCNVDPAEPRGSPTSSKMMGLSTEECSQHAGQPEQQQQQHLQQPHQDKAQSDAIRSTVLEWLTATGLSAKLRQDAFVNVQVDNFVAECRWNAQRKVWEAGKVVECQPQPHSATQPLQGSAAVAKPEISLPSPVAMLRPAPQHQQQQQLSAATKDQQGSETTHVNLTVILRNVGTRPLRGWGTADEHGLHAHTVSTEPVAGADESSADDHGLPHTHTFSTEPVAGTDRIKAAGTAPPFSLLARASDHFLPLTVSELAQEGTDTLSKAVDERLVQVTVQLPPELSCTTAPVALELELWEWHACFASHPVLLFPDSLSGAGQELALEWALVRNLLKQQAGARFSEAVDLEQHQHVLQLQEKQAALEGSLLQYLQDLADYLQSWKAEQEGVKHSPEQVVVIDAIGADLLHHAQVSGMPRLARLLSSRSGASSSLQPPKAHTLHHEGTIQAGNITEAAGTSNKPHHPTQPGAESRAEEKEMPTKSRWSHLVKATAIFLTWLLGLLGKFRSVLSLSFWNDASHGKKHF